MCSGCLRLICITVAGLGAPLSGFLEGAPYKFLNELMVEFNCWMDSASDMHNVCIRQISNAHQTMQWMCIAQFSIKP